MSTPRTVRSAKSATPVVVKEMAQRGGSEDDDDKVELLMENLRLFSNGTFSNVYRGTLLSPTNMEIAVKKSWQVLSYGKDHQVMPPHEVEIYNLLAQHPHKNIIEMLYTFSRLHPDHRVCTSLVFEFFPQSLSTLCEQHGPLPSRDVKIYTWQLFRGQAHLERLHICHRDIKPQNLLVQQDSRLLKIADFGSSKVMKGKVSSHSYNVTRYYRAPELILGATQYSCEIDRWSCGCVFGELLKNRVILPGKNATHQLQLIMDVLGYPTQEDIDSMDCQAELLESDTYSRYADRPPKYNFKKLIRNRSDDALDLLGRVLVYNPAKRLSGTAFLKERFFAELFTESREEASTGPSFSVTKEDYNEAVEGDIEVESGPSTSSRHGPAVESAAA